jgi:hypothetical protein
VDFDEFHATQVEESDNDALFFECRRRHFKINKNIYCFQHEYSTLKKLLFNKNVVHFPLLLGGILHELRI